MAQRDDKFQGPQYKSNDFVPKLRRNRQIELRWGNDYYEAVKTAVFGTQRPAFMPEEVPQAIKEAIDKTGYICKQCGDCFRFLSSIEEHTSRRSWVLGFWCQHCFSTLCNHKTKGKSTCSKCTNRETSKNNYLLNKGIKKNMKKGVTKIFYNQCQFFAHVKSHGSTTVDLSELMLMPLPCGIEPEHNENFDKIWKAVMELMFIKRIHIMDWVREKKIIWKPLSNANSKDSNDPIDEIVKQWREDCIDFADKSGNSQRQDNPLQFQNSRRLTKTVGIRTNSAPTKFGNGKNRRKTAQAIQSRIRKINDEIVPKDIAFVDCGSVPNNCISEAADMSNLDFNDPDLSVESFSNEKNAYDDYSGVEITAEKNSTRGTTLWQSFCKQYALLKHEIRETNEKSTKDEDECSSLSSLSFDRTIQRVLTIRNPTNINLSTNLNVCTMIDNSPNDSTNRKNLVVTAGNSQTTNGIFETSKIISHEKNRSSSLVFSLPNCEPSILPILSKNDEKTKLFDKPKISNQTNILKKDDKNKSNTVGSSHAVSQSFSEQLAVHGKIVFQNGRKYIIRHVGKSNDQTNPKDLKITTNFSNNPSVSTSIPTSIPTSKRLLLPKPPSMTVSSTIAKPIVAKLPSLPKMLTKPKNRTNFTFIPLDRRLLTENKKTETSQFDQSIILKIRESMENEFPKMSKKKLDSYIKNLKQINETYKTALGLKNDSIIINNQKTIERFEKIIASSTSGNSTKNDSEIECDFEINARNWETKVMESRKRSCGICHKRSKLTSYIVGLSPPATDENLYCHCYNNVCHICNVNQRSLMQLKFHIKWHKREKPFVCPDCTVIFRSPKDLEVHLWTTCFHPLVRHLYGCAICEIDGILDMESVAKHFMLLHTRRKFVCAECGLEYTEKPPSVENRAKHFAENHPEITVNSTEPMQLIVCNLKQCIVAPELFRAHLASHVGILKSIYYKCPFCPAVAQGTGRNKIMMLQHITENHLNRLPEIVSSGSLPVILKIFRLLYANAEVTNVDTSGPMIINARTITPQSFERGSEESHELHYDDSNLPKIMEIRSETDDSTNSRDTEENDCNVRIIRVKSMKKKFPESPKNEVFDGSSRDSVMDDLASLTVVDDTKIALKKHSSTLKNVFFHEDTSNSNDDGIMTFESSNYENSKMNVDYTSTLPKLERKPSPLSEENDDNPEFHSTNEYSMEIVEMSDNSTRKPSRIALNNPTTLEITPISYNCHICGEFINTSWSVVKNHFASHHSNDYELSVVSPQIPQISPGYIDGGYKDDCYNRKRKSDGQLTPGTKRRRRWGPKKYFEKPGSPSLGICVQPEPVREIEGSFRCKKCDEPFGDITKMREHIAADHRIKGQYLICLECGENFVVVPSLQMHLKALHGVTDPINYLAKHTSYAPDVPEDTEEEERTTESNQCYVCMAVFADKAAVDKHMRVHGMAFLKRKRFEARRAQLCSEKMGEGSNRNGVATSTDDKARKNEGDVRNILGSSVERSSVNCDAGKSEDREKNLRTLARVWGKSMDSLGSVDSRTSLDDLGRKIGDCGPRYDDDAARPLEMTESS